MSETKYCTKAEYLEKMENDRAKKKLCALMWSKTITEVLGAAEDLNVSREDAIELIIEFTKTAPPVFTWNGEDLPF